MLNKQKNITVLSVVLMNVLAILGPRWFAFAGKFGAASMFIWIAAACLFFIPLTFICAEFGARHPNKEAAITDWVSAELGEKTAFYASWFYFVTQLFYLPTLLTFTGICVGYTINPQLAENKLFITAFVIIAFWSMIFLATKNLNLFKKTSEINGFLGSLLPILLLILAAAISIFFLHNKIPTDFSPHKWLPKFNLGNMLFLVGVGTALAGAEVSAPFVSRMKNPQKDFPKAILLAALLIIVCYIIGTLAIICVVAPAKFSAANGIFQVLLIVFSQVHLGWVATIIFLLIAIGTLGSMLIWIVSPAKMFIDGNDSRMFPEFFVKKTSDGIPINAIIVQGFFITLIVISGDFLSTVAEIYDVFVMASSVLMFITYMLLLIAFLKMKFRKKRTKAVFEVPGKRTGAIILFVLAFSTCIASVIIPIISLPPGSNVFIYELEVIGIPAFLGFLGYLLYRRKEKI